MKRTFLVTGAGGEIGTSLLEELSADPANQVISLDLRPLPIEVKGVQHYVGSVIDPELLSLLEREFRFDEIYHLAGVLSSGGERNPLLAHEVNVEGTLKILSLAQRHSEENPVKVLFPSTIAVYGVKSNEPIAERNALMPETMYGHNKLYCERLGEYFSKNYNLLAETPQPRIDFRAIRFPGLISAETLPTGGTSDFGAEMVHAAARGEPYSCFVREDTRLPFMVMPDAVRALRLLAEAPREQLKQCVYNVTSFSLSAAEIATEVLQAYPKAQITFHPHPQRQFICDSWPRLIDDSAARRDWQWSPEYDQRRAFDEYLIPAVDARYRKVGNY